MSCHFSLDRYLKAMSESKSSLDDDGLVTSLPSSLIIPGNGSQAFSNTSVDEYDDAQGNRLTSKLQKLQLRYYTVQYIVYIYAPFSR
jgi:hypothetical protein